MFLWSVSVNLCFLVLPAGQQPGPKHTSHASFYNMHGLGGEFKDQYIDLKVCTDVFLQCHYEHFTCTRDEGKMGTSHKPMGIIGVYSPSVQMCKTGQLWLRI